MRAPDLTAHHGLVRIGLLKIGTAGYELQVLHGIEEGARPSTGSAIVEVSGRDGELGVIDGLFKSHGIRAEARQAGEVAQVFDNPAPADCQVRCFERVMA